MKNRPPGGDVGHRAGCGRVEFRQVDVDYRTQTVDPATGRTLRGGGSIRVR